MSYLKYWFMVYIVMLFIIKALCYTPESGDLIYIAYTYSMNNVGDFLMLHYFILIIIGNKVGLN